MNGNLNHQNLNSESRPGTLSVNLRGGRHGGHYVTRLLPLIVHRMLGLSWRWKLLLFIAIIGTLAGSGMFGAKHKERTEMNLTRLVEHSVDNISIDTYGNLSDSSD